MKLCKNLVAVQALTSSVPEVKKVFNPRREYVALISKSKPLSLIPNSSKNNCLSSPSKSDNSLSNLADIITTSAFSFVAYSITSLLEILRLLILNLY